MTLNLADINWLAVVAAALATFFLGGLWYTALFGKKWAALHGYTDEKMQQMHARTPPPVFFGVMLACYFLVAVVIAVIVTTFNLSSTASGAALGGLLWLLAAAVSMTGHIASDRHIGIFAIDTTYQLLYLVGSGAIIAGWR